MKEFETNMHKKYEIFSKENCELKNKLKISIEENICLDQNNGSLQLQINQMTKEKDSLVFEINETKVYKY